MFPFGLVAWQLLFFWKYLQQQDWLFALWDYKGRVWCSLILLQYLRGIVIQLEDQIHNGENTTVTNTYYQGGQI